MISRQIRTCPSPSGGQRALPGTPQAPRSSDASGWPFHHCWPHRQSGYRSFSKPVLSRDRPSLPSCAFAWPQRSARARPAGGRRAIVKIHYISERSDRGRRIGRYSAVATRSQTFLSKMSGHPQSIAQHGRNLPKAGSQTVMRISK